MARLLPVILMSALAATLLTVTNAAPPSAEAETKVDLEAAAEDDLQTSEWKHLFWLWPWAWGDWRNNGIYPGGPPPGGFGNGWGRPEPPILVHGGEEHEFI